MLQRNGVGNTALMIAYLRAKEAEEARPLFSDTFAHLFLEPEFDQHANAWRKRFPLFQKLIRLRTRWFDDIVAREIENGRRQIIVLGAGCCARALRFGQAGVTFYEVDQPSVIDFKAERLALADHAYPAVPIRMDYTQPGLMDELVAHGVDFSRPTLVIWEGNTYYLTTNTNIEVLRRFNQHFRDITIAFDFFRPEVWTGQSRAPSFRHAMDVLAKFGAPWIGGIADAQVLARELGMRLVEDTSLNQLCDDFAADFDMAPDREAEYDLCVLSSK